MLSGRGLCDGLITRPEESCRLWCVDVGDLETSSRMRRPWPALGCSAIGGGKNAHTHTHTLHVTLRSPTRFGARKRHLQRVPFKCSIFGAYLAINPGPHVLVKCFLLTRAVLFIISDLREIMNCQQMNTKFYRSQDA